MRVDQAEVFDLGYQPYTGPREGRARARRAVFENGVRSLLGIGRGGRAKVLPVLLFLSAMTPALVFVAILALGGPDDFIPGPADYYAIIGLVLMIFGAIMAPELLIPDRRDNVLQLYLVRTLSPTDYLGARFFAFFGVVLALVYSGQIVLQLGLIFTATEPLEYLRDNWLDIPRFLAAGVVVALFFTVLPMLVATFTTRRAYAAVFVIAAVLASSAVADGFSAENCTRTDGAEGSTRVCERPIGAAAPYVALLHLGDTPGRLNAMIFDRDPDDAGPSREAVAELHAIFPIGFYVLLTGGAGLLLWNRYRSIKL